MLIVGIIVTALLALAAARLIDIAGGMFVRRILERRLAIACRGSLVLTYDDGPGRRLQPRLMQSLEEHDAQATFFLLGSRARENPNAVNELVQAGHTIASHSNDHLDGWRTSPWRMINDIHRGEQVIADELGHKLLYRPPLGRLTLTTWLWCLLTNRRIVMWTVDGRDSLAESPRTSDIRRVVSAITHRMPGEELPRGGCVLLHSFDRSETSVGTEREDYVLEAAHQLLSAARAHNMPVVTLDVLSRHGMRLTRPASEDPLQSAA